METVILRRWRGEPKSVIALLPDIPADDSGHIQPYEHIGQHGGADYNLVISRTVPAYEHEDDAKDLLKELQGRGYELVVRKRRGGRHAP